MMNVFAKERKAATAALCGQYQCQWPLMPMFDQGTPVSPADDYTCVITPHLCHQNPSLCSGAGPEKWLHGASPGDHSDLTQRINLLLQPSIFNINASSSSSVTLFIIYDSKWFVSIMFVEIIKYIKMCLLCLCLVGHDGLLCKCNVLYI